jgi:hypothetical protein
MFSIHVKFANKSRFSRIQSWNAPAQVDASSPRLRAITTRLDAIEACIQCIPPGSTSTFQVREGKRVIWTSEPNTSPKGIEAPVGQNLSLINLRVDRRHVGESCLSVVRHVKASCKAWKVLPKQIRRGIIQAVITRHKANRDLYIAVMSGNLS